jgi:hypothetical protein
LGQKGERGKEIELGFVQKCFEKDVKNERKNEKE